MIAVTVVTPSYRHLEKECVRRIKKFTGLPVKVIRCADKNGFMAKLNLDKHCGRRRILFVDVDFWWLRECNVRAWCPNTWMAVHDSAVFNPHAFPHTDCAKFGMDKMRYFNSGMFTVNFSLPDHRKVFQLARQLKQKKRIKPVDKTDQFYLNLAAQRLNVAMSLVPTKFNLYLKAAQWGQLQFIPRDIIGLHAAGEPLKRKMKALKEQAKVFEMTVNSVWPEAQMWEHSRIFEMR